MTVMIRRVKTVFTTPLFASSRDNGVRITRWTERRKLPPPVPAYDDDIFAYFDEVAA